MAGLAIENSMLGAAHACANPLTARYDITHGRAIALMLPHVVRRNATDAATDRLYGELLADLGPFGVGGGSAGERLADRLDALIAGARLPGSLAECGVERDSLSAMAREAAAQWTANFNPIKLSEADFVSLYGDAFAPVEDADAGVEAGRLR
jgi:alcohol dehydrogenase